MKKLLFVNGCIRGEQSRTLRLARRAVSRIPNAEIEVLSLPGLHLMPYDGDAIAQRDALSAAGAYDAPFFALANQFKEADAVVLACPYWDLTLPSMVRAYLERLCVIGLTFHYNEQGYPVGDCKPQRLLYITTRGGYVDNNDTALTDHASAYLRSLCAVLGVPRFDCLAAEGLDVVGNDVDAILAQSEQQADQIAAHFWEAIAE